MKKTSLHFTFKIKGWNIFNTILFVGTYEIKSMSLHDVGTYFCTSPYLTSATVQLLTVPGTYLCTSPYLTSTIV